MTKNRTWKSVRPLLLAVGAAMTLSTAAYAQPANDACTAAITVTNNSATSGDNSTATTEAAVTCTTQSLDVWYDFTAGTAGVYNFNTEGSTQGDTVLALFDACAGTQLACDDDGGTGLLSNISFTMTAGQNIKILLGSFGAAAVGGGFTLNVSGGNPPAGNDECATATTVLPGSSTLGTNGGSTGTDITACAFNDTIDVWYKFTTTIAGFYQIDTEGSTMADTTLALYDACGGTELACDDDGGTGFLSLMNPSLNAATQYFIRVAGYNGSTGNFTLNVGSAVVALPPANDTCTSATVVTLPFTDNTTSIAGATADADLGSCNAAAETSTQQGVWYTYTPAANQRIRIQETSVLPTFAAIFSNTGGCAGSFTELGCSAAVDITADVLAGQTYYILVGAVGPASIAPPAVINLSIVEVIPPSNDVCSNTVTAVTSPSTGTYTTLGASSDIASSSCGFTPTDAIDVWFRFTPATTDTYKIDTIGSVDLDDTVLSIWTDCPGGGGTELLCNDDSVGLNSAVQGSFNAGTTYYIRVAGWNNQVGEFLLNLSTFVPLSNDTCGTAINVTGTQNFDIDNSTANNENAEPAGSCNAAGAPGMDNSIWFTFTPGTADTLQGTCDSAVAFYDIVGVLYTGTCGTLTEVACWDVEPFDFSIPDSGSSALTAGVTYYLAIGDWGQADGGGDTQITLTVPAGVTTGACCEGTTCVVGSAATCSGANQSYAGNGTVCNVPGNFTTPCCKADFNHVGGVTVQDIFDFLNAYFNSSPLADINGGGTSVQDIFDFLNAYFTGCV